jgi:hypothetical protein
VAHTGVDAVWNSEERQRHVHQVRAVLNQHAELRLVLVGFRRLLSVVLRKADEVRRAEESLPKERLNFREPWPVRVIFVDCEKLRVVIHGSQKSPRVLQGVTEGFLADDMDSRLSCSKAMYPMQPGHAEDIHEIQPLLAQHGIEVCVHAGRRGELVPSGLGPTEGAIAEGHDLHLGDALPAPQVELRDHPAAEYPAAQLHAATPIVSRPTVEPRPAHESVPPRPDPTPRRGHVSVSGTGGLVKGKAWIGRPIRGSSARHPPATPRR